MTFIELPQVTLCAATSVNVTATQVAMAASLFRARCASAILFTDALIEPLCDEINVVKIDRISSTQDYSEFLLSKMPDHVTTSHCLVVQWDGHVRNSEHWRPEFLEYDYIGASWPQFSDGHNVGNGGFSLRSKRLMELCREEGFHAHHPEDMAICRTNRRWLESKGMRFAPKALADLFAAERHGDPQACFGYHGVWNMPRAIGVDGFWNVYQCLDDRSTIWRDFRGIFKEVSRRHRGVRRGSRMLLDRLRSHFT